MRLGGWTIGAGIAVSAAVGLVIYETRVAGPEPVVPPAAPPAPTPAQPAPTVGVSVVAWIDPTAQASVVPLWALGQHVDQLRAARPELVDEDGQLTWTAAGLGPTGGSTKLTAEIENNHVVWLAASVTTDAQTTDELVRLLTQRLGTPTGDRVHRWSGPPPISLTRTADRVYLTVGTTAKE